MQFAGGQQTGWVHPALRSFQHLGDAGGGHSFRAAQTYKREDFVPIALLNADPTILVVRKDAPGTTWLSWWPTPRSGRTRSNTALRSLRHSSRGMAMFTHAAGNPDAAHPHPGRGTGLDGAPGRHVDAFAAGPERGGCPVEGWDGQSAGLLGGQAPVGIPGCKNLHRTGLSGGGILHLGRPLCSQSHSRRKT